MPRGYKRTASGLPTGPGTIYEMCGGDEEKARQVMKLVEMVGMENVDWLADQMAWWSSIEGTLTEDEMWAEMRRRMPADVRASALAHLERYYQRHPEEADRDPAEL